MATLPGVGPATRLAAVRGGSPSAAAESFDLPGLAGHLVEVSGEGAGAVLTAALALVLDAQRRGEWAAWVAAGGGTPFPPDAAATGVDLAAFPVVRAPGWTAALRAADFLVRSGAFGLVVADLGAAPRIPAGAVARLAGLARRHAAVVLCLAEKPAAAPSLGPRVAVRVEALRVPVPGSGFLLRLRVLRDRRRPPGGVREEPRAAPEGLLP